MKTQKIIYWLATGLLSAMMIMSAGMYFFNNAEIQGMFESFGYPTYLIYPLAVAKIAGVVVLLTQKQSNLKEWAYSAFFFEFILAFLAHYMISDGQQGGAVIAMILLMISYFTGKIVFNKKE